MSGARSLSRLLTPGTPFGYWRVSEIAEARYDLPDEPMAGGMDSAFFLTRDRNFIPHEYPCRTRFAADHRDRRPDVRGTPEYTRDRLPFGAPDLDLSGFWFRPTRLAAWARTGVVANAAGIARFRLSTCGGAVLFVNGRSAGFLSPYLRNRESSVEISARLPAGPSKLVVFFDDLAERDTRFTVRLEWLGGPSAHELAPFTADAAPVAKVESILAALHFERPSYAGGEIRVRIPNPLAAGATLRLVSQAAQLGGYLPAGATGAVVAEANTVTPGFHTFEAIVEAEGFAGSRSLTLEIVGGARALPEPRDRLAEALDVVAEHGGVGSVSALARFATDRADPLTEAMLRRELDQIADCWDCADFALVPLLWCRARYAGVISPPLLERIDATVAGYRYWLDEPGNDVQWYFSENHALLFHTAAYLAGHLLPGVRFVRSGRIGAEQSAVGRARVRAWLDHFERWEMAEFNSAPYFPIDIKGLTALFALAPDADIRARAGRSISRLLEIVANSAHQGILTAAQGRSYEHSLCSAASLELASIARLLWGRGGFGTSFHCLPMLALCLRDHGLALPDLTERAVRTAGGAQEWCFRQGPEAFAALYHYKTRAFAIGSAARYRWGEWGYQETLIHARLGPEPQAQIWINHPGELIQGGSGRPSYWGGSASIPRVQQYRALAIVAFEGVEPQPDLTHAWFPRPCFDAHSLAANAAFSRGGEGLAAIIADGPLEACEAGPSGGCELRLPGRRGRWILRLGDTCAHGPLESFRRRFATLAIDERPDGRMVVDDPDYGVVVFHPDGRVTGEGRSLDPGAWTIAGTRTEL